MIDWTRIDELKGEIGEDDFDEVVDIFLEEVEEVITRMRANPVPEKLESDLHFLKGSALNLGFAAFSRLCRDGEYAAAAGNPDTIDLPAVFSAYEESKTAFLSGP